MSRSLWIAVVVGLALGAGAVALIPAPRLFVDTDRSHAVRPEPGVRYACPMLCVIADTPGSGLCPVCGMNFERMQAGALNAEQRFRMGLETTIVTAGPATMTIRAYGTVQYDHRARQTVIARVSGRVVQRHPATLHAGIDVAVGDPLLDLYSPEVFAAQGELQAAQAADEAGLIAAMRARFTRWGLEHVATAVFAGEPAQDTITVRSPFAGRVLGADAMSGTPLPEVGAAIMADTPLLTLADPARLIVVLHVPETQGRYLTVGQRVTLASDDHGPFPDLDARISWIAPEIVASIRSREVHVHLRDADVRLLPGALVAARIRGALAADLTAADPDNDATWGQFVQVPKAAVLSTGVRHLVWTVTRSDSGDWTFAPVAVALGPRLARDDGDDHYVVRAGLTAGSEIVARGAFLVDSQAQLAGSPSLLFPDGAAKPAAGHAH